MHPEVADVTGIVKYIGKDVFQHQGVGGLCMPPPNFGCRSGGRGFGYPYPPAPPSMPKMLFCKVDQSWHIKIFLYGHFFLGARTAIFKKSVKGDGITCVAWRYGLARKQAKVREGSETSRRLGRFSSACVD